MKLPAAALGALLLAGCATQPGDAEPTQPSPYTVVLVQEAVGTLITAAQMANIPGQVVPLMDATFEYAMPACKVLSDPTLDAAGRLAGLGALTGERTAFYAALNGTAGLATSDVEALLLVSGLRTAAGVLRVYLAQGSDPAMFANICPRVIDAGNGWIGLHPAS